MEDFFIGKRSKNRRKIPNLNQSRYKIIYIDSCATVADLRERSNIVQNNIDIKTPVRIRVGSSQIQEWTGSKGPRGNIHGSHIHGFRPRETFGWDKRLVGRKSKNESRFEGVCSTVIPLLFSTIRFDYCAQPRQRLSRWICWSDKRSLFVKVRVSYSNYLYTRFVPREMTRGSRIIISLNGGNGRECL